MRLWRSVILTALVALIGLQAGVAATSRASSIRFLVTVRATVTKQWTYTTTKAAEGCASKIKGSGARTVALRSSDVSVVRGTWPGGNRRARFTGSVRIAGTIKQAGAKTTTTTGDAGCSKGTHRVTCARVTRSFRNKAVQLVSRRVHRLGFRRIAGLVPDDFFTSCPGEPSGVRALAGGIELAGARYSERDLFDRNTAGVTLQGSADITTKLLKSPGSVVQHVRWTLSLRRVGA
jgi:hypothetical protein